MNSLSMTEDEKRKEIESDLSLNMFVEAGAGAGKTTLIVRRIVNMLKGDYEPSQIVAITFTNKAAEELRGRIFEEVKNAGLTDKLYRMDEMNISTIHSFCNVLLKEQGEAAGLPQDLVMIQGDEEKQFKKGYLNDYLRTLDESDWDKIEKDGDPGETRRQIRSYIEELFMSICDLPSEVKIAAPRKIVNVTELMSSVEHLIKGDPANSKPGFAEMIVTYAAGCFNDEKNKGDKKEQITSVDELLKAAKGKLVSEKTVNIVNEINKGDACDIDVVVRELTSGKPVFLKSSGLPVIYDKDSIEKANESIGRIVGEFFGPAKEMTDLSGKTIKDASGNEIELSFFEAVDNGARIERHFRVLTEYAKKARDYYNEHRPINKITNEKLLELTRDLILGDDPAPLEYFQSRFRTFFVDEFQDTDSLQSAFIYRLAGEKDDPWKLRDGALFVVGDPKQSIYRFRGAEPEVYFHVKEDMEKLDNAKTYELSKNFRSNDSVIKWVNEKFEESDPYYHIVNTEINGSKYVYKPMDPVNVIADRSKGTLISGVYRYDDPDNEIANTDGKTFSYTACDTETDVDNLIKILTELTSKAENGTARYEITRYKKEEGNYVAYADGIKFSDFLLISPDTTQMDQYVTALKKHGIPVVLDGRVSVKRDKALNVYARVYRYLINPRGPFYRIAAAEAIRESIGWENEKELMEKTDGILDCLYDDCKHMTPYGKAQYLESQISVLFDKDKDISAVDVLTVRTHIRQMLESININIIGTGEDIIEEMSRYIETGLEHEMSLKEAPDAVRFMNLHKAKGLEGNIVVLLDRRGRNETKPVKMRIGDEYYPGVSPKYGRTWSSISGLDRFTKKHEEDETSEFHRLEYVAITRAKQAAIFLDAISKGKKYERKLFAQCRLKAGAKVKGTYSYNIRNCEQIFDTDKVDMPDIPGLNLIGYKAMRDDYTTEKEISLKDSVSYIKINPSGLEKGSSPTKEEARREAEKAGRKKEDEYSTTLFRPIGNLLGDALHNAMELIVNGLMDDHTTDTERLVSYCSTRAVANLARALEIDGEFPERREYERFVAAGGRAYVKWLTDDTNGGSVIGQVEKAYTELPFSYCVKEGEGIEWHNGSADLILKNKDGSFVLIDYKSDNEYLVSEEVMHISFKEKYAPQLEEYRNVIMKLFNADPEKIKTGIISFSQKDENGNRLEGESVRIRYTQIE